MSQLAIHHIDELSAAAGRHRLHVPPAGGRNRLHVPPAAGRHRLHVPPAAPGNSLRYRTGWMLVEIGLRLAGASDDA